MAACGDQSPRVSPSVLFDQKGLPSCVSKTYDKSKVGSRGPTLKRAPAVVPCPYIDP